MVLILPTLFEVDCCNRFSRRVKKFMMILQLDCSMFYGEETKANTLVSLFYINFGIFDHV